MSFAYYAILSALLCWKWGDWKNWRSYYPTAVFVLLADITYKYLTQFHPLWNTGSFLYDYPFLNLSVQVILYSCTVILFLTFYDRIKTKSRRILYIAGWVAIYSVMEYISLITGHFYYYNGWTFLYSVIFDIVMFLIILLHYKKPLWACVCSIPLAYLFIFLFNIPLKRP